MPSDADQDLDRAIAAARPRVPAGFADAVARRIADRSDLAPRPRRRAWRPAAAVTAFAAAAAVVLVVARGPASAADLCVVADSSAPDLRPDLEIGARLRAGRPVAIPEGAEVRVTCAEGATVVLTGAAVVAPRDRMLILSRGQARIEGPAIVATTWARVVGADPDALIDLNLSPEENDMNATALTSVVLAATAGSVLTVTVIRGGAHVGPSESEKPTLALRAGDSANVPAEGPVELANNSALRAPRPDVVMRQQPGGAVTPTAPKTLPVVEPSGDDGEACAGECDPSECEQMPEDQMGEMTDCEQMGECPDCAGQPPAAEPTKRVTVDIQGAPALGRADARVVIVEFGDFQCPFCEHAMSTVHAIAEQYPNDVQIVFKNFPLPGHKQAGLAAEAALAAGDQGKFWEMYDLLFANRQDLDRASLESYALQLGLDMGRFRRALDQHTFAARVADDVADATALGIKGIPTFLVNGRVVQGALPLEQFKAIVEEELRQ